jgi:hypothetical protein
MNLLCPNCQKLVTVPEQSAGQTMQCPMCSGTFTVPGLPHEGPEPLAYAPPPATETYGVRQEPAAAAAPAHLAEAPAPESHFAPAAPPPSGPSTFSRGFALELNPHVVPWLAPVGMLVVFLLTFFPWIGPINAWEWGFSSKVSSGSLLSLYDISIILAMLLAIASLLIHLKVIPEVPALQAFERSRNLIVGAASGLAFLLLFIHLLGPVFEEWQVYPLKMWAVFAFWSHLIAVIGAFLEYWLDRRGPDRPLPGIAIRW